MDKSLHDGIWRVHFGKRLIDAFGEIAPAVSVDNAQRRSQDVLYFQERQFKPLLRPCLNKGAFVETRPLRRDTQCEHELSHACRQRPFACMLNVYVGKGLVLDLDGISFPASQYEVDVPNLP